MLTDLRCWRRTRVVMLANFHYNSVMTLSVYISALETYACSNVSKFSLQFCYDLSVYISAKRTIIG